MNKRQLYAAGEPIGDSCTSMAYGKRRIYGGGGSSSSSSNQTQTTNTDKRMVLSGGVGVSSDQSTVNVTNTSLDPQIVQSTLDAIKANDATNGQGFSQLLTLADTLFQGAGQVIQKTQDSTMGQISALNTAAATTKGALDQKTLLIIAAGSVAAIYAFKARK
jgi:hypothetical protein